MIRSSKPIEITFRDTVEVLIDVYPKTAILANNMLESHQIYINRVDNKISSGGEPSEYKITQIQEIDTKSTNHNSYCLFIADTDMGHGYRDTIQICIENKSKSSNVSSNPLEIKNCGTNLFSFSLGDEFTIWDSFNFKNDTIQIQVPNSFNTSEAIVYFKHNGKEVILEGKVQKSGESVDLSDFCNPKEYVLRGFDGEERKFIIEVFNLPIIFVNTPNCVEITSRYEWQENCTFKIRDTDGTIEDYGIANVKGRGNWSWRVGMKNGKKPLAIKLENKPKDKTVLGMPGHKRWVLLANPLDYLPNPIGFEITRRATSHWAPRCRYVELFVNGKHSGLYLLCEQIKIDKNRINIKELKKTDIEGEAVTGGYLISYDDAEEDDDPRFYSQYYKWPIMIKNPDSDDIAPEQLAYIQGYINQMEEALFDDDKFESREYANYMDVDSWIDYYLVEELWGAYELGRPRSVWMYKDRNGKMTAGPGWDFEQNYFSTQELLCKNVFYYQRLFQDPVFVNQTKKRWKYFYDSLYGGNGFNDIEQFIDSLYNAIKYSAARDRKMVPSEHNYYLPQPESTLDLEYKVIKEGMKKKIDWLSSQIGSW